LTNDSIRLVRFAARTNDETQTEIVEGARAATRARGAEKPAEFFRGKTCRSGADGVSDDYKSTTYNSGIPIAFSATR